jgi:hypothetical protein
VVVEWLMQHSLSGHERRLDLIPLTHSMADYAQRIKGIDALYHKRVYVYGVQLLKRIRTPSLPSIILIIMPTVQV